MAAKQLAFDENARNQIKGGVDALADAVKVTLGSKGKERRSRQEVWRTDNHEGWCDRCKRDRTRGSV